MVIAVTAPAKDKTLSDNWRDLLDRHYRVTCAVEKALQDEHGLGVSEFEVLEQLAGGPKDQHRMQELAGAVFLSQSALSRLIGRLESEGLVTRAICSEDRRGIFACLTTEGRSRYEAARPTQRRGAGGLAGLVGPPARRAGGGAVGVVGRRSHASAQGCW